MSLTKSFNPTPISKLLVTLFLSFTLGMVKNEIFILSVVFFIAVFFSLNNRVKTAFKIVVFYGVVILIINNASKFEYQFVKNYILIFIVMIKIFFLPFLAGKFFIATSDVSSMIVSFEKMRFPKVIVIPLAVVFRYFPAFKDDKKNIKMAMKMRGISHKNPIKYIEYVSVPMLISASNIADDISKAAETKCIADPCKKVRYNEVNFGVIDIIYILGVLVLFLGGKIYG